MTGDGGAAGDAPEGGDGQEQPDTGRHRLRRFFWHVVHPLSTISDAFHYLRLKMHRGNEAQ
jgi:hypothetical protein